MKQLFIAAALAATVFGMSAQAATPTSEASSETTAAAPVKQQNKMKTCNADAKTKALKGDERKAFMKECLSAGKSAAPGETSAKSEKSKACSAEAKTKGLKGDERKSFVKECTGK